METLRGMIFALLCLSPALAFYAVAFLYLRQQAQQQERERAERHANGMW